MSWENGCIGNEETGIIGYSVRMSMDDCTSTVVFRADEPITNQIMINALLDLAEEIKKQAAESYDGDH